MMDDPPPGFNEHRARSFPRPGRKKPCSNSLHPFFMGEKRNDGGAGSERENDEGKKRRSERRGGKGVVTEEMRRAAAASQSQKNMKMQRLQFRVRLQTH